MMLRQDVELSDEAQARGGCLTAWLLISFIGSIVTLSGLVGVAVRSGAALGMDSSLPAWFVTVGIVLELSVLVFLIAIWKWKKWGIIGLVGSVIVVTVINLYIGVRILSALNPLIKTAILLVLIIPRWHLFTSTHRPSTSEVPEQTSIAD